MPNIPSRFGDTGRELSAPASNHFAITPHDSTNFTEECRGIYVGVGGDIVVVTQNDDAVTYKNAQSGSIIPIRAKRVNSTSTTATNLVGLI